MTGKLIALESTNQQLLDKTARYLALKLQSEGKLVEVLSFPQTKQTSSHFAQSHQKGEYGAVNPYAASMFYILDRYDANALIKQYLQQETIVICKSYRGTMLAKLGVAISDAATRKGYYIWADSLESGTFGGLRPDKAIVLSEELPTLYELCELFPKDYVFAVDPTNIRNLLNDLIPPAVAVTKKQNTSTVSFVQALASAGKGKAFDFVPGKNYVTLPKKSKSHTLYANGLRELEVLKEAAVAKVPKKHKKSAVQLVTPIGIKGVSAHTSAASARYNNRILQAQIVQNFEQHYGTTAEGIEILQISPHNELDVLATVMLSKTETGISDIQKSLQTLPIAKKTELYKAYIAGVDNDPENYPLYSPQITIAATVSYADLLHLHTIAPSSRFTMQHSSPRWGFAVPDYLAVATDEIEDCFISSLKLHAQLEAAGEHKVAGLVVLAGHFVPSTITLDGLAIRNIAKNKNIDTWVFGKRLKEVLAEKFPLLCED